MRVDAGSVPQHKKCASYTGPEMTAPSMEEMSQLIMEKVVK